MWRNSSGEMGGKKADIGELCTLAKSKERSGAGDWLAYFRREKALDHHLKR